MKMVMKRAGAGVPSANRITLLRDADGDGVAETQATFLTGLNSPFGMALVGDDLYVANTDARAALPLSRRARPRSPRRAARSPTCRPGRSIITGPRTSSRSPDGTKLYVTRRLEQQRRRERHRRRGKAAPRSGRSTRRPATRALFASGLRNPIGMALAAGERRAVDRGQRARRARQRSRPRLHDLGQGRRLLRLAVQLLRPRIVDPRVKPQRPDLVAKALVPDYALGPHTASLGLAFSSGASCCPSAIATARSSASTARGTASRAAATR